MTNTDDILAHIREHQSITVIGGHEFAFSLIKRCEACCAQTRIDLPVAQINMDVSTEQLDATAIDSGAVETVQGRTVFRIETVIDAALVSGALGKHHTHHDDLQNKDMVLCDRCLKKVNKKGRDS